MHFDLVEALGSFEEARAVYDEMLALKVATPQNVLNYADFLMQRKFWEDAFRVYERGIALFRYPHVEPIWHAYLTAFVDRHKGGKMERARDLFSQVCCCALLHCCAFEQFCELTDGRWMHSTEWRLPTCVLQLT